MGKAQRLKKIKATLGEDRNLNSPMERMMMALKLKATENSDFMFECYEVMNKRLKEYSLLRNRPFDDFDGYNWVDYYASGNRYQLLRSKHFSEAYLNDTSTGYFYKFDTEEEIVVVDLVIYDSFADIFEQGRDPKPLEFKQRSELIIRMISLFMNSGIL